MRNPSYYDKKFFDKPNPAGRMDKTRRAAEAIIPIINEFVRPGSVIDVGCGVGTWLSVLGKLGVRDLVGVDGPWVYTKMLEIPERSFIVAELDRPFRIDRVFDLAISVEVAEHLLPERAETFVEDLTRLAPVVLFSAAVPHQGGYHHTNEQWQDYWVSLFASLGYVHIDCVRPRVWRSDIDYFYVQNSFIYVKSSALSKYPTLAQEYERRKDAPVSLVHPSLYLMKTNPWWKPGRLTRSVLRHVKDKLVNHGEGNVE